MSAEAAITRTWKVGARTATLHMPPAKPGEEMHATIEWTPDQPSRLTSDEWHEYQVGRAVALSEISAESGIPMVVLDLL